MRLFLLGSLLFLVPVLKADDLKVGIAAVPITPSKGTPMAGYYFSRAASGVHDDLFAKAIVMTQGTTTVGMVVCDLISMPRPVVEEARALIEKQIGLPGDSFMISATHSHTGPILAGRTIREEAQGGASELALEYRRALPAKIAEAVEIAFRKQVPAQIFAGIGREEKLSFNRRYFMTNGTVGWNPGKMNPAIIKPAGPIDPEIPVVFFKLTNSHFFAGTYVNFAMHPDTVGGESFSADYPYSLGKILRSVYGSELISIFAIGTAGDINHLDVSHKNPQQGPEEAERIGTILAGEVIKTSARSRAVEGSIKSQSSIVTLDLPSVTAEEVEAAKAMALRYGTKDEPKFLEKVHAFKVLDVNARQGHPHEVEVQVIAVGNELAWVGLPGEIFVELGLAIKKASPFKTTIIAELANGSLGYVPTRQAYAQGNYEVVSSRCAEGSGEKLVEAAVRLLKEIHQAK